MFASFLQVVFLLCFIFIIPISVVISVRWNILIFLVVIVIIVITIKLIVFLVLITILVDVASVVGPSNDTQNSGAYSHHRPNRSLSEASHVEVTKCSEHRKVQAILHIIDQSGDLVLEVVHPLGHYLVADSCHGKVTRDGKICNLTPGKVIKLPPERVPPSEHVIVAHQQCYGRHSQEEGVERLLGPVAVVVVVVVDNILNCGR